MVISRPIRGGKTLVSYKEPDPIPKRLTIKDKIMIFVKKNSPVLINDFIISDLNHCTSRRPVEKAFEELTSIGLLKREKCICKCSYIYSLIGI